MFPELSLVLFENLSKMKLLSDLLDYFFSSAASTAQCSLQSTISIAGLCQQTLQLEGRLQYSLFSVCPDWCYCFICLRNLFHNQTKQGKHNIGIRKLSSLRARFPKESIWLLLISFLSCPGVVCLLLCLGFLSHAKSMVRELWLTVLPLGKYLSQKCCVTVSSLTRKISMENSNDTGS